MSPTLGTTPTAPLCLCAFTLSLRSADEDGYETYLCHHCQTQALRSPSGWLWARPDGSVLRWLRGADEIERLSGPTPENCP